MNKLIYQLSFSNEGRFLYLSFSHLSNAHDLKKEIFSYFSMNMFTLYMIVISLIIGLISTKPIEDKLTTINTSNDLKIDQAFQQAEQILNRYFYLIKSDADHLVHAMLSILLKNPKTFPYIPSRALDIAFKNLAQKMGQNSVDTLTKPLILSIEQNAALNKSKQLSSSFQLTDEVKVQIEDALDKFFQEQGHTSHM